MRQRRTRDAGETSENQEHEPVTAELQPVRFSRPLPSLHLNMTNDHYQLPSSMKSPWNQMIESSNGFSWFRCERTRPVPGSQPHVATFTIRADKIIFILLHRLRVRNALFEQGKVTILSHRPPMVCFDIVNAIVAGPVALIFPSLSPARKGLSIVTSHSAES